MCLLAQLAASVATHAAEIAQAAATVIEIEGTVQSSRARAEWQTAQTNDTLFARDRIRTRERSRSALRLMDRSLFRLGELSELTVEPPDDKSAASSVSLIKGLLMFFHRGEPRDVEIRTRTVSAAIRGTEFQIEVAENGRTLITLFDGEVELTNPQGSLRLVSGEQAAVDPGQAPVKTAMLLPRSDIIQWCLYYPGVLDIAELSFALDESAALSGSLSAYRAGDLPMALAQLPQELNPATDAARIYIAAVHLSVGKTDTAARWLDTVSNNPGTDTTKPSPANLATAVRDLIQIVKQGTNGLAPNPQAHRKESPTALMVESYRHQAQADLGAALHSARRAAELSPQFAFAHTRRAELELSFGRHREARSAIEHSLELAPRNAQAIALRGFLHAAENRTAAALEDFNTAIAIDGALGNAWLGRGLCRIRRGDLAGGRDDLQVAALMEPQRSLLRSYLGKAWQELGDRPRALDELRLAKAADPRDPTAYFYEALLLQEGNRINESIDALERAQGLNDNRQLYRSRLMLDRDAAARSVSLATIYRDAGMTDWSAREAGKAVSADYANWSAHQFLASSHNALRDPSGVNLRHETPWLSEYLIANLLSPGGAGILSQSISQQEYARMFERDHVGVASTTDYLSRGAWSQSAIHYGRIGGSSYALEGAYTWDPGQHRNGHVEQWGVSLQFKQQFGDADGLYLQAGRAETRGGDLNEYATPNQANPTVRFRDEQEPLLLAGYHHEWSPQSRTLLLASHVEGTLNVADAFSQSVNYFQSNGVVLQAFPQAYDQRYRSSFEFFGGELQHIWQLANHTVVLGALAQSGDFSTRNRHVPVDDASTLFWGVLAGVTNIHQQHDAPLRRTTFYAYDSWQLADSLQLVGGLAYDSIEHPRNHRYAPIDGESTRAEGLLPKAGVIWRPSFNSTARAAYTRSLSGASYDQSFRLEPTQVAGFNQAFRSVTPETLAGANAGAEFDAYDLAWEQRIGKGTYVGLTLERLQSSFNRRMGGYGRTNFAIPTIGSLRERIEYEESSVTMVADQLIGREWVLGARYRWSRAELVNEWRDASARIDVGFDPDTGDPINVSRKTHVEGTLHELELHLLFNHSSGIFAGTEGVLRAQDAEARGVDLASAGFWQWNATLGWRSPRRNVEVSAGLLNILDAWDGLQPINLHFRPPNERTFAASVRLSF